MENLRPANPEEILKLQKQNPETQINPINSEDWENSKNFKTIEDEKELRNFSDKLELQRNHREFVEKLEYMPLKLAINYWLSNLGEKTRRNYRYYINDLIKKNIIPEFDGDGKEFTVGHFRHMPHEAIIDHIKKMEIWSEGTRQVKCAVYISLTAHLERLSNGWFRKAIPSTMTSNPTFFQIRDKVATEAISLSQWHKFIDKVYEINSRDGLIAKTLFHGAKRISEVLELTIEQIDFEKKIIRFKQKKTGGTIKEIPITYPESYMSELKNYIEETKTKRKHNILFITSSGKQVVRSRFNETFAKASKLANLKIKVSPHVLRATWVTLCKQDGANDTDIMKVTGHTSSKMIYQYDKTSMEENLSKKIVFI